MFEQEHADTIARVGSTYPRYGENEGFLPLRPTGSTA